MTTPHQRHSLESLLGAPLNEFERKSAPAHLNTSGRIELLRRRPRISIVGTRNPSNEGQKLAAMLARAVVEVGGIVVSGLAKGIDTVALNVASGAGGDVIAVIGTPLSRTYPAENKDLQRRLMRDHLVVSQFDEGTTTYPRHFPQRNQTMALLTNATVIVEAGESSGTMHQGWEALRLGRLLLIPQTLIDLGVPWALDQQDYGAIVFRHAKDAAGIFRDLLPSAGRVEDVPRLALNF